MFYKLAHIILNNRYFKHLEKSFLDFFYKRLSKLFYNFYRIDGVLYQFSTLKCVLKMIGPFNLYETLDTYCMIYFKSVS